MPQHPHISPIYEHASQTTPSRTLQLEHFLDLISHAQILEACYRDNLDQILTICARLSARPDLTPDLRSEIDAIGSYAEYSSRTMSDASGFIRAAAAVLHARKREILRNRYRARKHRDRAKGVRPFNIDWATTQQARASGQLGPSEVILTPPQPPPRDPHNLALAKQARQLEAESLAEDGQEPDSDPLADL